MLRDQFSIKKAENLSDNHQDMMMDTRTPAMNDVKANGLLKCISSMNIYDISYINPKGSHIKNPTHIEFTIDLNQNDFGPKKGLNHQLSKEPNQEPISNDK